MEYHRNGNRARKRLARQVLLLMAATVCLLIMSVPNESKANESEVPGIQYSQDTIRDLQNFQNSQLEMQDKAIQNAKSFWSAGGIAVSGFGTLMIGLCALRWIFSSSPEGMKTAKTWLISTISGVALYWLAWLVLNAVISMEWS